MNPLQLFTVWHREELNLTKVSIPSACCLSTIGLDNYPNARFLSLKEILEEAFIITGTLTSRKGLEIAQSSKVALTFWWTETKRQVRIQGDAIQISKQLSDKYFSERAVDAQIISLVSNQGKEIDSFESLNKKYQQAENEFGNKPIARPENWGGYSIKPLRIEFMEFKPTRFHDRKLYELVEEQWMVKQLQP